MGTTGQSITLANSIIGVGILAMPFCFQQCGVILATAILLFMGLVSRLCCHFLLKSALMARRRNFEFLGFHVFGLAGKMAVELGIIGFLMGTCIAYFVVVGDLGPQIIAKMFNINQSDILRTSIMVIVSLVCVLPLGLLRNVDSLSNVSAATIGFYFCLVIKVVAEAASLLLASEWQTQVAMWKPAGLLQCVPIFSMALFCQTQLFEIFESMPSLSLEKMNLVTKNAINICTGVYFTLGLFGYIAFSSQTISGNILMSLSPTMASDVIKLGFVMSVACSFPLIIFPCRASLYSFLYKKVHSTHHDHLIHNAIPESTFRCITVAIIAVALFVSLLIPNIELVLGLVGSTIGVLICLVFPAACFVNVTFKNTNERVLAKGVIVLGVVIMVLGTYANLQAAENQVDRYDEKLITQERIDKIVEDFFESKKLEKKLFDSLSDHQVNNGHEEQDLDKAPKVVIELSDSEVQPPNPEPPEANSKESMDKKKFIEIEHEETLNGKNANDNKAKDENNSHPRNLKSKLDNESKQINLAEIKNQEQENNKKENLEQEKKKQEEEKIKHAEKLQDKIDMIKHQQLIETIKKHGAEQKVLLEEQKEILQEIEKKKEEIKNKKKDADNVEAKKMAVESIQKIALKAIESLGGVSEKTVQNEAKKPESIEVEAVQQIAKHAVESIVAIQDAGKEKSDQSKVLNAQNVEKEKSNVINAQNVDKDNEIPRQNNINAQNNQINVQNGQPVAPIEVAPVIDNNIVKEAKKLEPVPANLETNNRDQNVQNPEQTLPKVDKIMQQDIPKEKLPEEDIEVVQDEHLHAPDEPQSYKQGEDAQKEHNNNEIVHNVPLPLALIAKPPNAQETKLTANEKPNLTLDKPSLPIESHVAINDVNKASIPIQSNVAANGINDISHKEPIQKADIIPNPIQIQAQNRQKREVVDCTEKSALKPEDKQICDTLVNTAPGKTPQVHYQNSQEILSSKVDLSDHVNRLSIGTNVIHRSLKSFDESER